MREIHYKSSGGALTAETAAWLPAHGLPQVGAVGIFGAGAVGIFGAGAVRFGAGDSAWAPGLPASARCFVAVAIGARPFQFERTNLIG